MRAMPTSGEQLGPYHLSIALGFTDRSAVFSANHTGSGREVTVAVMLPDHADDLEAVQQFFREARSLKVLSHENLVEVVDILEEPQPFFAVEAMRGQLLSEMTKPAKLPLAAALHIAWQVCQGLRAAHESGEIHRALRPGSIFVLDRADEWGTVKILGFSTVSPMAIESAWPSIAPEQWRGEFVDHRTDIYSYGALLYELTTGRRPITGTTIGEFRHGHERSSVVPPSTFQPMMPQALDMLIEKCLAKDPEDRPQTMQSIEEVWHLVHAGSDTQCVHPLRQHHHQHPGELHDDDEPGWCRSVVCSGRVPHQRRVACD